MGSANRIRTTVEGVLATLATGLMFYFGNGLEPWWPLMWLAPLPVLWFALRCSRLATAVTAVCSIALGMLNLWSYLTKTLGAPASVWLAVTAVVAVVFVAGTLLFRALVLRGAVWSAMLALPSIWVTLEYLRNLATPHGSAGSLAYSQLRFLPFLQLASVTGPWGMTFVLMLFSSALAIALHLRSTDAKGAVKVAVMGAGVTAVVLAFGVIRLAMPRGETARVGLIASDAKEHGGGTVVDPGAETEKLFDDYARAAESLTAQGAQAIVIPEKIGVTLEGKSQGSDAVMQSVADSTRTTVVAGVVHVDGKVKHNEARVYLPGASLQRYDKEHMLPPFESNLKPGTTLVLLPRQKQTAQLWGVAICKDMDFANPARRYAKEGAGLMLVPAWDFVVDRSWHGHIAVMRGVEGGFSIARAAKNGYLTVSDDRGRIVGEVPSNAAPFATLVVDAPATHHWTVYQAMGDWFAWVAIALFVYVLLQLMRTRHEQRA